MNAKQRRFAEEYVVDHNGTQAAIRAGYSEKTAKVQASQLLAKPDVTQLVSKMDGAKRAELGIEAREFLARVDELWEKSVVLQPKVWKGEPITGVPPSGRTSLLCGQGFGGVTVVVLPFDR